MMNKKALRKLKGGLNKRVLGLEERLQVLRDIHGSDIMVALLVQKDKQPVVMNSSLAYQNHLGGDEDDLGSSLSLINSNDKRVLHLRKEASKAREDEQRPPDYVN